MGCQVPAMNSSDDETASMSEGEEVEPTQWEDWEDNDAEDEEVRVSTSEQHRLPSAQSRAKLPNAMRLPLASARATGSTARCARVFYSIRASSEPSMPATSGMRASLGEGAQAAAGG